MLILKLSIEIDFDSDFINGRKLEKNENIQSRSCTLDLLR